MQKTLGIIPVMGWVLVEREMRGEATDAGVLVTRRDQEEKPTAIVVHPGFHADLVGPMGSRILVDSQCGTDFWSDALGKYLTFLDVANEVFARVPHGVEVDHGYI